MKNYKHLLLNLHFLIGACAFANLSDNVYIKIGGGLIQYSPLKSAMHVKKISDRMRAIVEGGVGYKINSHFKVDASFHSSTLHYLRKITPPPGIRPASIQDDRTESQNIKTYSVLVQAYINPIQIYETISPFVMVGCGVGYNKTSDWKSILNNTAIGHARPGKNNVNFIWTVGAGIIFTELSHNYSVELGYKYIDLGKIKFARATKPIGLREMRIFTKPKKGYYTSRLTAYQITTAVNIYL